MMRHTRQKGMALLAMLAVLVLGAAWFTVSAVSNPSNRVALDRDHNARVLAQAKQALLDWAARNAIDNSDHNPGRLPCPEPLGSAGNPATEGIMQGTCGAAASAGRLPWRSLGLPQLRDASGEPLWYVVSGGWKLSAGGNGERLGINSNAVGNLALDGAANGAVAIVIAPGAPTTLAPDAAQLASGCIARVQRRGVLPPNALDYIECHNVAGASVRSELPNNTTNPVSNDQTAVLTASDVLAAVEPVVAARITRDVLPTLQNLFSATYNSIQWGNTVTAASPVLPFAAPFANPAASTFQGAAGQTQGLMPLSRSQCAAGTPLCDTNFVRWDLAGIAGFTAPPAVAKTAGSAGLLNVDCGASNAAQVSCNVRYGGWCGGGLGFLLGGVCTHTFEARATASALNVGNVARTFTQAGIAGFTAIAASSTPLNAIGAANADIRGSLPNIQCNVLIIFGLLIPCWVENTVQVRIPIGVFPDHPALTTLFSTANPPLPAAQPNAPFAWEWFMGNNWHQATYYAIAPRHAPNGAGHDCRLAPADCLTLAGGTLPNNTRAVLVFAGRSLATFPARPNGNLADYLDTAANQDGNTAFEQKGFDRTFNDRFFAISNY
jgi:hypothetical protein